MRRFQPRRVASQYRVLVAPVELVRLARTKDQRYIHLRGRHLPPRSRSAARFRARVFSTLASCGQIRRRLAEQFAPSGSRPRFAWERLMCYRAPLDQRRTGFTIPLVVGMADSSRRHLGLVGDRSRGVGCLDPHTPVSPGSGLTDGPFGTGSQGRTHRGTVARGSWAGVVDSDTLDIGQTRVRLHGIDAPESSQNCLADGRRWPCGERATRALADRIDSRMVSWEERDRDKYGRSVAGWRKSKR